MKVQKTSARFRDAAPSEAAPRAERLKRSSDGFAIEPAAPRIERRLFDLRPPAERRSAGRDEKFLHDWASGLARLGPDAAALRKHFAEMQQESGAAAGNVRHCVHLLLPSGDAQLIRS